MGGKESGRPDCGPGGDLIRSSGFSNPEVSFSAWANGIAKESVLVERFLLLHHVVGSSCQLVSRRAPSNHHVRLRSLAVIPSPYRRIVSPGQLRGLSESPGKILVTVLLVASPLLFIVARPTHGYLSAIRSIVPDAEEPAYVSRLQGNSPTTRLIDFFV
jgi:hypothetical protein